MKKCFENIAVDCWVLTGRRLGKVQPCVCLRAEPEDAGILLKAVEELAGEPLPATRKITLRSARPDTIRSVRLRFSPVTADLRFFSVSVEKHSLVLEFTEAGIADIRSAMQTWIKGAEDFCLYPHGRKSDLGEKDRASGDL